MILRYRGQNRITITQPKEEEISPHSKLSQKARTAKQLSNPITMAAESATREKVPK